MGTLQEKTALVTGGSQGVGRAIAMALAKAGARVIVHGRDEDEELSATVAACRDLGAEAEGFACDLSQPTESLAQSLFEQANSYGAAIDILINNAGTYHEPSFLDMSLETFDRTMKLNVYSHFLITQQFARAWIASRRPGCVIFTGSINGRLAEPTHVAYDTSKGAIEMMVKSLCVELAPHGIRVNGMAPGLVYTPLTAPALDDPTFRKWMEAHTPSHHVPGPDVCGDVVVFLASDAARHIHGQMILVDGGMSVWQQPDPPAGQAAS